MRERGRRRRTLSDTFERLAKESVPMLANWRLLIPPDYTTKQIPLVWVMFHGSVWRIWLHPNFQSASQAP